MRRRYLLAITFLIVSIGNRNLVASTLSSPPHPILGNWTIVSKDSACAETYRFRPNGMLLVTSGREVAEVRYDISPSPSDKGFYKWTHRILRNNNKPDCSGKLMNPGEEFTWFIQIDASNESCIYAKRSLKMPVLVHYNVSLARRLKELVSEGNKGITSCILYSKGAPKQLLHGLDDIDFFF